MNYYFKPSFARSFKKMDPLKQRQVFEAIEALKTILEEKQRLEGLGLKQLSKKIWEIRSTLKDRILFTFKKDTITFILVGNHDDVVKFLKSI